MPFKFPSHERPVHDEELRIHLETGVVSVSV
jgi:hypothetical protein